MRSVPSVNLVKRDVKSHDGRAPVVSAERLAKTETRMVNAIGTGVETGMASATGETAIVNETETVIARRSATVTGTATEKVVTGSVNGIVTATAIAEMRRTVTARVGKSASRDEHLRSRRRRPQLPTNADYRVGLRQVAAIVATSLLGSGVVVVTTRYVVLLPVLYLNCSFTELKADRSSKRSSRKDGHHEDRSRRSSEKDGHERGGRESDRRRKDRDGGDGDSKGLSIDTKVGSRFTYAEFGLIGISAAAR